MPKRSLRGDESRPARVVAPISVNSSSRYRCVRACTPLSKMKSTAKSSMAGYRNSSTTLGSRWISSIKKTSPLSILVRSPIKSPPFSSAGPDEVMMRVPISPAMMCARVVFPSPGGPLKRRCSRGSLLLMAASIAIFNVSTMRSCPMYSPSRRGLKERNRRLLFRGNCTRVG